LSEGTYDKEYVATRTYGFEKWRDYVLGKEDGDPKTPEWAELESGIPAREIKALAREWAKSRTRVCAGTLGGGAARAAYATEWTRMVVYLMAMQGMGKPGSGWWSGTAGPPYNADFFFPGYADGGINGDGGVCAAPSGLLQRGFVEHPVGATVNSSAGQHVPRLRIPEALWHEPIEWRGKGFCGANIEMQFKKYKYPEEGYNGARMYWRYGAAYIGTMNNTNRYVKAYHSPYLEFAVCQSMYLEGEAKFADLILPACTNFERDDIGEWAGCGGYGVHSSSGVNRRVVVLQKKCIEPLGESKSDYQIFATVAKKMGFYDKYTENGRTEREWVRRMFECSDVPNI
jgi:trimethylamine-N-oxide reductase (cytochrome c)